jgi:NADPH:quinone reductase-like Zn-dependent oxidoreductase
MKAYEIQKYGDVNGLKIVDRPLPELADREVMVRIKAASLNYRDLIVLRGQYTRNSVPGRVPLSDGAGEVIAVGAGVERFKVGDKVAGCFFQGWLAGRLSSHMHQTTLGGPIDGVLAEQVKFHEHGLVHLPRDYSFIEGATLPCAALTAWQSLIVRGGLVPGETVLLPARWKDRADRNTFRPRNRDADLFDRQQGCDYKRNLCWEQGNV